MRDLFVVYSLETMKRFFYVKMEEKRKQLAFQISCEYAEA